MANAYPRPQQGQGISREEGGAPVSAGVWEHPESGERAITLDDPLFGNAQSQAFKQVGFVFVRPADPSEIKTMPQLAIDSRAADESNMKGLSARLDKLEGVADENEVLKARVKQLEAEKTAREGGAAAQAAEDAKQAAEEQVAQRQAGEDEGNEQKPSEVDEKPLNKQNASELKATAEAEGVDVTEADTNKKLVTAIQAARDTKESEN